MRFLIQSIALLVTISGGYVEPVAAAEGLLAAVRDGAENTSIELAAGTYELGAPLELKKGMTLVGSGIGSTVLVGSHSWRPPVDTMPDPEMKTKGLDTHAYLIRLQDKAADVTISGMTLRGPLLHGAVFGSGNEDLHLHDLRIEDFLWSGIRTFGMRGARIHDCEFVDAGGRWERGGKPGSRAGSPGAGSSLAGSMSLTATSKYATITSSHAPRSRPKPRACLDSIGPQTSPRSLSATISSSASVRRGQFFVERRATARLWRTTD